MDRDQLRAWLAEGLSLAEIAARVDRDPTTVGYWVRKHGLSANGSLKHTSRGGIDEEVLEILCEEGSSIAEMAAELDRSTSTVSYWLKQYGLESGGGRRRAQRREAKSTGVKRLQMECRHHGLATFFLRSDGGWRCMRCNKEAVVKWRRRAKLRLVKEAGGKCRLCGYDEHIAALQFHHLDPSSKSFGLSMRGITRSFDEMRAEAEKCVLLCANCHAAVEAGLSTLPVELKEAAVPG
jgi:transposase-like protein